MSVEKNSITIDEYINYALKKGFILITKWMEDMFMILKEETYEDEYIKLDKTNMYVKVNDELYLVSNKYGINKLPLLIPKIEFKLSKDTMVNNKEDIVTTIGTAIINYVLLVHPFKDKIPYINKQFGVDTIQKDYIPDGLLNHKFTIEEYITFVDSVTYMEGFGNIYSVSLTEKALLAPPGIKKFKDNLIKQYIKEYGENVLKDKNKVIEIENKISEYEDNYIKDDLSYGKLVSGKVKGARKKMYGSYGLGLDFTPSTDANYISDSLYEGYGDNRDKLATYFNDARLGSYARGAETQKAGSDTQITLNATNDIKILPNDCGTKLYETATITKDYKLYKYRYMFDNNGNTVELTEEYLKNNIGKSIKLRTPRRCNTKRHFCKYCTSSNTEDRENVVSIMISNAGGIMLNEMMKKMHNTTVTTVVLDMDDLIS